MKCDCHVHTRHSHDGKVPLCEVVRLAKEQGLCYMATTEHLDYDFEYGKNRAPVKWSYLDLPKYYEDWKKAKQALDDDKNNTLNLAFGIEASYDPSDAAKQAYQKVITQYPLDVVINSVHCVDGYDMYFKMGFLFKSKKRAYRRYLETILESLDAPYPYEIVAHIGYIAHGAPYKDKVLRYKDFPKEIDAVLNGIIERGKVLEINFHHDMAPPRDIIERYFELGGRKISFGSDAHRGDICRNYEQTCKMLREIGFTHFSTFVKHQEVLVEIPCTLI